MNKRAKTILIIIGIIVLVAIIGYGISVIFAPPNEVVEKRYNVKYSSETPPNVGDYIYTTVKSMRLFATTYGGKGYPARYSNGEIYECITEDNETIYFFFGYEQKTMYVPKSFPARLQGRYSFSTTVAKGLSEEIGYYIVEFTTQEIIDSLAK